MTVRERATVAVVGAGVLACLALVGRSRSVVGQEAPPRPWQEVVAGHRAGLFDALEAALGDAETPAELGAVGDALRSVEQRLHELQRIADVREASRREGDWGGGLGDRFGVGTDHAALDAADQELKERYPDLLRRARSDPEVHFEALSLVLSHRASLYDWHRLQQTLALERRLLKELDARLPAVPEPEGADPPDDPETPPPGRSPEDER